MKLRLINTNKLTEQEQLDWHIDDTIREWTKGIIWKK